MSRVILTTTSANQTTLEQESTYILLDEGAELPAQLNKLEKKFHECFNHNKFNIILDMVNIKLPPTRFIVTLIEATCQARRMGGDIKLINLTPSIRNNLVTFSPRTYLSIEPSEKYALYDFGETLYPHTEFDISDTKINAVYSAKEAMYEEDNLKEKVYYKKTTKDLELIKLAHDEIRIQSKVNHLYDICDFVLERAEKAGFDLRERGKIKVTVYEACLNVIEHAYFSNPEYWIHVSVGYDKDKFVIIIQDWGESFEFDPSRTYDVEQVVKDRKTGGFGLHIIRRSVDEINYLSDPNEGNRLILVKYINLNN